MKLEAQYSLLLTSKPLSLQVLHRQFLQQTVCYQHSPIGCLDLEMDSFDIVLVKSPNSKYQSSGRWQKSVCMVGVTSFSLSSHMMGGLCHPAGTLSNNATKCYHLTGS